MFILKLFLKLKKSIKFVVLFFDLHIKRFAITPFLFDSDFTNNNTPPMPINDAHLGGFFILKPYEKSLQ